MRDSVRLNSRESFLVSLPLACSENWVMYSSAIFGLSLFCDWFFLGFSGASFETAANLFLFLNVAIILGEKLVSCEDWCDFYFINKSLISSFHEGKSFNKSKQLRIKKLCTISEKLQFHIIMVLSFLLFRSFPWRETNLFTRQFKVKMEENALIIIFTEEKCRLWRKNSFSSISSFTHCLFSIFRKKSAGLIRQKRTSKCLSPRRHSKEQQNQKIKKFFHRTKLLKNAPRIFKTHKIKYL